MFEESDHQDTRAHHLFRSCIERIEVDYLRAIAFGPGHPVFMIFDLEDPDALEAARKVQPAERIEDARIEAATRGVTAFLIHFATLANPRDGDHWWSGCPDDRFPVGVYTGGSMTVFARLVPEGVDEALRKRLLVVHEPAVYENYLKTAPECPGPLAVIVADLADEMGRRAATAMVGEAAAAFAFDGMPADARPIATWSGNPSGPCYPSAWDGEITPGRFAVQVIAYGGVLNATLAIPTTDLASLTA